MALAPHTGLYRSAIRSVFRAYEPEASVTYRHSDGWTATPPSVLGEGDVDRLVVVVPTITRGHVPEELHRRIGGLLPAVTALRTSSDLTVGCALAVALYDASGPECGRQALTELDDRWGGSGVPLVGLSITARSKILAINWSVPLLAANHATAVAWFDDDVQVAEDCLVALWRAFTLDRRRVYGGAVRSVGPVNAVARIGASLRGNVPHRNRYPYGCSVLLSRELFGAGIPLIYMSDDHYLLLNHIDPTAENALHRLVVVPDARVGVREVGTTRLALRRIWRNYRGVQRVLADTDPASSRIFIRQVQFPDLRFPHSAEELAARRYWLRLAASLGRRAIWLSVKASLVARAIVRRPVVAVWSTQYER